MSPHLYQNVAITKKKKKKKTCIDEDIEKLDPLCTVGRNAKWYSHFGRA